MGVTASGGLHNGPCQNKIGRDQTRPILYSPTRQLATVTGRPELCLPISAIFSDRGADRIAFLACHADCDFERSIVFDSSADLIPR